MISTFKTITRKPASQEAAKILLILIEYGRLETDNYPGKESFQFGKFILNDLV